MRHRSSSPLAFTRQAFPALGEVNQPRADLRSAQPSDAVQGISSHPVTGRLPAEMPPKSGRAWWAVERWADRPCGICGLLGLWPLGRCRTGRVIPSVGGVPELPALPIEGTRDDRGREPE